MLMTSVYIPVLMTHTHAKGRGQKVTRFDIYVAYAETPKRIALFTLTSVRPSVRFHSEPRDLLHVCVMSTVLMGSKVKVRGQG